MKLEHLTIHNFRLFEDFTVEGLATVNLFAGRNNCGKTTLLEALRIMAAGEEVSVLHYLLYQRGQSEFNVPFNKLYDPLFNRRILKEEWDDTLAINGFHMARSNNRGGPPILVPRENGGINDMGQLRSITNVTPPIIPLDVLVYVPMNLTEHFPLEKLWDSIVLTPKEDDVVDILRETIMPDLIRLDVKPERVLVRLKGEEKPLPLKSLGDGAQRMLQLAIALVAAKDNLLLIDEIEAGLHYSVMEELWKLIFKYAREWDIQVFATTHSNDAIKTFLYTLETGDNEGHGRYFRLQKARKTGQIEAIAYDKEQLEGSILSDLETR